MVPGGLSVHSVLLSAQSHVGCERMALKLLVAGLAWIKARVFLRHYLEVQRAGTLDAYLPVPLSERRRA